MRHRSIRFTLTAWYTAMLAVTIYGLGAAAYLTMRHTIIRAADHALAARLEGVGPFVAGRLQGQHAEALPREFEMHLTGLTPGGEMLQVADGDRHWIYQSPSISAYEVALPPIADLATPRLETVASKGGRLRVMSARVRLDDRTYLVQLAQSVDPYYEMLDRFRELGLWFSPLVFALSWAGGYALCRRALAPVDAITRAARSIGAQNLGLRLNVPETGDELQRLSETLNAMIARLDGAFARISEFTADAAHELRTPLSIILTTAELSLRHNGPASLGIEADPAEVLYREALQQIYEEAVRTNILLDNLMTLARADSAEGRLALTPVDLRETVRAACRRGAILAAAKQIAFTDDIVEQAVTVRGHAESLQRLLLILIDNAVKFTPEHGRVSVSLGVQDSAALCEVADSGPGIPAVAQGRIFERFYRVDPARSRNGGGVGLGLAIARWIADEHHASLEVDHAPGTGAVFRLRIPLDPSASEC